MDLTQLRMYHSPLHLETTVQNKRLNIPPITLTATLTTNLLNPTLTSAAGGVNVTCTQPYLLVRHMRVVNSNAAAATVSLFKGLTGANTAFFAWNAASVPGNGSLDWYGEQRFDTADFLVGGASTTGLYLDIDDVEIGFSG